MSAKKPFLQQQSAWLLRKPPLPCHRGGGNHLAGGGRGVGVPAHIYIYIHTNSLFYLLAGVILIIWRPLWPTPRQKSWFISMVRQGE